MRGRPKKNVIPFERHDEVVHNYVERKTSLKDIANQFAVSTEEVRKILKANDVQLRPRGRPALFTMTQETEETVDLNYLGR